MQRVKDNFPILCILFIGVFLRFFNLGTIPGETFDEVFYPLYGLNYISGEKFFSVHPPLGNYLMSFGIYLYYLLPWTETLSSTSFELSNLNPVSYRWLGALAGSALIWVSYNLSLLLFNQKKFAILVALFFCLDGSFLVDSRFGLINIYMSFFGFLSLLLFITFLKKENVSVLGLCLTAIVFGLAFSIKWNGLGFFGASLCSLFILFLLSKVKPVDNIKNGLLISESLLSKKVHVVSILLLLPFITYAVIWIPELIFSEQYSLIDRHINISSYHSENINQKAHPYSSSWYEWPFMTKPIGYYFLSREMMTASGAQVTIFNSVHLFPNLALYLCSLFAVFIMSLEWMNSFFKTLVTRTYESEFAISSFILVGFYINFIPWAFVSRSTFLYHYQPSSGFAFMALGLLLYKIGLKQGAQYRTLYCLVLFLIVAASIYWLPLQLGLDIDSESFYNRMWSKSWI